MCNSNAVQMKAAGLNSFQRFKKSPRFCHLMMSSSLQMCTKLVRNWSIAGSLLIQREPNCVKLITADRCVCFHSWLRCSAEPLSLYFIEILPKSIKGSVFYTLTLSLIKLALIISADGWHMAKKTRTVPRYMPWAVWSSSPLSWAARLRGPKF